METEDKKKQFDRIDGFVFYRSYFEAIKILSKKNKLLAYEALAAYALDSTETTNLPPAVFSIVTMAIPNLDANRRKYLKKIERKALQSLEDVPELIKELSKRKDEQVVRNNSNNDENAFNEESFDDFI